jgi:ATP-binding cassette subfamily F protein 3
VERLATKIVEVGQGGAQVYPGTYTEFLWSKANREAAGAPTRPASRAPTSPAGPAQPSKPARAATPAAPAPVAQDRDVRKKLEAERRKRQRAAESLQKRIVELENRIAVHEQEVKSLEAMMAGAGFFDDPVVAKPVIDRHQQLMWEVGDLMSQWEALQEHAAAQPASDA